MEGNLVWPGEYSQCLKIDIDESMKWKGKHCTIANPTERFFVSPVVL
jgi:hypothetical protein